MSSVGHSAQRIEQEQLKALPQISWSIFQPKSKDGMRYFKVRISFGWQIAFSTSSQPSSQHSPILFDHCKLVLNATQLSMEPEPKTPSWQYLFLWMEQNRYYTQFEGWNYYKSNIPICMLQQEMFPISPTFSRTINIQTQKG
jgi:hypothetical protein